jgi:Restriction endonuclease BglII
MEITGVYSHKDGEAYIKANHGNELNDIYEAVANLSVRQALCKESAEKTKKALLFSPVDMNYQLKNFLSNRGWTERDPNSKKGFKEPRIYLEGGREFREMDGIKNRVGLEVQFGKYAFMGYDIFSKMPIFSKWGLIDCGIELVVMPSIIQNMSTGVSSFAQIVMDMKARGVADIDIPTLILGFECTPEEWTEVAAIRKDHQNGVHGPLRQMNGNRPGPK